MSTQSSALHFTNRPPEETIRQSIDIVRTPPEGKAGGIVLSTEILGHQIHYFEGRSVPCVEKNCPACSKNLRPRWYSYFALWLPRSREYRTLELTAKATLPIIAWIERGEQLRGAEIIVQRKSKHPQSEIRTLIDKSRLSPSELPECFDLPEMLARMWGVHRVDDGKQGKQIHGDYGRHFLGGKPIPEGVKTGNRPRELAASNGKHTIQE